MGLPEDDPRHLVADDQPDCQVEGTFDLLDAGLEGELDGGPTCAPVRLRGWCLRLAPLLPYVVVR